MNTRILARLSAAAISGALIYKAVRDHNRPRRRPARPKPALQAAAQKGAGKPDPEQLVSGAHAAGRGAASPWEIPWAGWKAILKRTYLEFSADRVLAVAAGVTYFALLAIFPSIAALVSLYGLVADRTTLAGHVSTLAAYLPAGGVDIVSEQLGRLTAGDEVALGFSFLFSLGLALWSSNAGMKAVFDALNVAYDEDEKRGFFRLNLISLTFTAGALLFLLLSLGSIAVVPAFLQYFGLEGIGPRLIAFLRWPALLLIAALGLSVLYRFGPSRADAKWQWITPGSLLAAFLWITASTAFSWYAANFASFNETYGTLGGVVGLMMWMWLSSAVILFGAELNAEAERQTARDSTTGKPRPRGKRGAVVADEVASP